MKTNKYLLDQIKHLEGRIITIDAEDYLLTAIDKNDAIKECIELDSVSKDDKWRLTLFSKRISSKKMRKKFKKKKIDTIILNNKAMKPMLNTFIRDSIYMTKKTVYIYGSEKESPSEVLIHRYQRYNTKIEKINEDGYILKIDTSKAKNNWFKDLGYYILDNWQEFIDMLASYLVN
jgi:CRISPR/Cas system CMR subunit Cmr4 (Cas7 group RAMP superfamily)